MLVCLCSHCESSGQTHYQCFRSNCATVIITARGVRLCFFPRLHCVCAADSPRVYLQWVLGADGKDLVLEVAELAAPGASLADPADEAGLMGAAHRAVTAAGAQQLALQDTKK